MLFGIKKIEYCAANALAFSGAMNEFYGVASELSNQLTPICFVAKRATLTIDESLENKEVLYTAKLTFVTDSHPGLSADSFAFVVTTNDGERILIGAQFRPRVVVTTSQTVAASAGELTAYTTTAVWTVNYQPLRLPVSAAVPISGPALDICCGAIKTKEPISGPIYDICCGQIAGEEPQPILLTVIWQNYDGTVVDTKTYREGQPEPTTSVVPTKPATTEYTYTFAGWELYSQTETTKIYRATYTEVPATYLSLADVVLSDGSGLLRTNESTDGKRVFIEVNTTEMEYLQVQVDALKVLRMVNVDSTSVVSVDWHENLLPSNITWIVENNIKMGYYVGNNAPSDIQRLIWYADEGNIFEDWNYYVGKAIEPPTTPPTKTGYRFLGWAHLHGAEQPDADLGTMPNSTWQFYAVWQAV